MLVFRTKAPRASIKHQSMIVTMYLVGGIGKKFGVHPENIYIYFCTIRQLLCLVGSVTLSISRSRVS